MLRWANTRPLIALVLNPATIKADICLLLADCRPHPEASSLDAIQVGEDTWDKEQRVCTEPFLTTTTECKDDAN